MRQVLDFAREAVADHGAPPTFSSTARWAFHGPPPAPWPSSQSPTPSTPQGLIKLRMDRDWPGAIKLLNQADSSPLAGSHLSTEIHNHWHDWKKDGRPPAVDVTLMSPELFASFLSSLGFQWDLEPQNLQGYQLHLRGKELRHTLADPKSEHLRMIWLAYEADIASDPQSQWELLQIASLGRLTLSYPWLPRTQFDTRFPMAAYLAEARSRDLIDSELTRLDAFQVEGRMNPPIIITAALELARGDEAAAIRRLEAEKALPRIPLPPVAVRLAKLRAFLADSDSYAKDPTAWWKEWVKGFPKD